MTNLEYLGKIKEDGFRKYIIEKSSDDLEGRKALALEIIAETLISIDDNLKAIINVDGDSVSVIVRNR